MNWAVYWGGYLVSGGGLCSCVLGFCRSVYWNETISDEWLNCPSHFWFLERPVIQSAKKTRVMVPMVMGLRRHPSASRNRIERPYHWHPNFPYPLMASCVWLAKNVGVEGDIRSKVDLTKCTLESWRHPAFVIWRSGAMRARLAIVARRDGGLSKPPFSSKIISFTPN